MRSSSRPHIRHSRNLSSACSATSTPFKAALELPLKMLKRSMYGRAGFELLGARVLYAA
jgi:hypothetical protein